MRKVVLILIASIFATVAVWVNRQPFAPDLPEPLVFPLAADSALQLLGYPGELEQKRDAFSLDQLMAKIDPAVLERMQSGSAATNGYSFSIKSSWVSGLSDMPLTSLKMRYNPETDTYELLGAGVEFEGGLGVGYEEDPESGEPRGYFQFRKSF
ncbi:hypothetical protein ACFLQY_02060 [Verrucomicrobiota bacterium]